MGNPRCQYRHTSFVTVFINNSFSAFTSDNRHDGSDQCWMEGEHVGNFGTKEEPEYYCIFHAPDDKEPPTGFSKEDREASQLRVLKNLLTNWNKVNANFGGKELLTFVLPGMQCFNADLDYFDFSHDINFSSATFSGLARFEYATFNSDAEFDKAKFSGSAWFNGAEFSNGALFDNAKFNSDARFNSATFSGDAAFYDAKFSGDAWFNSATFSDAWFSDANFGESAWFNGVEFNGRAYFNNTSFKKLLWLSSSSFNKGCWFTGSKFGYLQYSVHLGEKILFNACSGTFTFTDQDCSKLSFLNMDLSNAGFLGADIKNTRFEACRWKIPEKSSYSIVHRHKEIFEKYRNSKSSDDESAKKKAEDEIIKLRSLYLQLKKNLEEGHYFRQAGEFHYREMEIREMLEKRGLDKSMLWLYRWLADFGENWIKLGIYLLLSFVFFAGLVYGWERLYVGSSLTHWQAFEAVFLAVVPSVFRKGADLHLVSKGVIILETVTALVLAALFAMSVRRRFRR